MGTCCRSGVMALCKTTDLHELVPSPIAMQAMLHYF
jgi:hypothetical protein